MLQPSAFRLLAALYLVSFEMLRLGLGKGFRNSVGGKGSRPGVSRTLVKSTNDGFVPAGRLVGQREVVGRGDVGQSRCGVCKRRLGGGVQMLGCSFK